MTTHQKEVRNKILVVGDETVDKISLINGFFLRLALFQFKFYISIFLSLN
jgi:hypothetical protein